MGRGQSQKPRDKNQSKLPQTPRKDIAKSNEDLELAKELDERYDIKEMLGEQNTD